VKEEVVAIKNGQGWFVKRTHFIVSLIVLLIVLLGSIVSPFVWKATIDLKVQQNANDILKMDKKIEKSITDYNDKIDYIYKYLLNKNSIK